MLKKLLGGVAAGVVIGLGGSVFLASENKVVGAALFTVALLCICCKGYNLYTGKIGFIPENHDREAVTELFLGLAGNVLGTLVSGLMLRAALPALGETATALATGKLSQTFLQTLLRGVFCGILMYLAVSIFKEKQTPLGVIFCIPVFILSGFEHSVADMFYFAAGSVFTLPAIGFIASVVLGNTLGGVLLPVVTGKFLQSGKAGA